MISQFELLKFILAVMALFQSCLITSFSPFYLDRSQQPSSAMFSTDHQYIHCTGNMFLLIPTQLKLESGIQGIKGRQSIAGKFPNQQD